jgi:hypothetical protein
MGTADPIKDCEFANFWKRKSSKTPKSCANRKSNPGQMLGRHLCYHYTIGASNLRFRDFTIKNLLIIYNNISNTIKITLKPAIPITIQTSTS